MQISEMCRALQLGCSLTPLSSGEFFCTGQAKDRESRMPHKLFSLGLSGCYMLISSEAPLLTEGKQSQPHPVAVGGRNAKVARQLKLMWTLQQAVCSNRVEKHTVACLFAEDMIRLTETISVHFFGRPKTGKRNGGSTSDRTFKNSNGHAMGKAGAS